MANNTNETNDTSNTAAKPLTHFIGMNGTGGCMPDSCNAYETHESAVESLSDLLELSDEQVQELRDTGYVSCTVEQGADYAEVTECTCDKPWDHNADGFDDDKDNWPEYVKAHVLEFLKTLETHEYQDRVVEHDKDRCRCEHRDTFHCLVWVTKTLYLLPNATYGDYDNSCAVERSNARVFNELPYVTQRHGGYGTVWTGVDEDDIGDISWHAFEALKEQCDALSDYPVLDEDDMSALEIDMQNDAWSNWAESDFKRELSKRFKDAIEADETLEDKIQDLASITDVFERARDKANVYWECESGGNMYIDLARVAAAVELSDITDEAAGDEN